MWFLDDVYLQKEKCGKIHYYSNLYCRKTLFWGLEDNLKKWPTFDHLKTIVLQLIFEKVIDGGCLTILL